MWWHVSGDGFAFAFLATVTEAQTRLCCHVVAALCSSLDGLSRLFRALRPRSQRGFGVGGLAPAITETQCSYCIWWQCHWRCPLSMHVLLLKRHYRQVLPRVVSFQRSSFRWRLGCPECRRVPSLCSLGDPLVRATRPCSASSWVDLLGC